MRWLPLTLLSGLLAAFAGLWDQVGERLRGKEMPPAKSKQPTDDERQQLEPAPCI